MAKLLWAYVYYHNQLAGILREEPSERVTFTYDENYLESGAPAIAHTLPLEPIPYTSNGLPAFFDNLTAEGWLQEAQMRLLGKRIASRFELLMTFGRDCAGAVSIVDPDPIPLQQKITDLDPMDMAVLASRASLSGVQPKLAFVNTNEGGKSRLRPAKIGELSDHIVKFASKYHSDLVYNEYLTSLAFKALLPNDDIVDLRIEEISGFSEPALIIKRFDREENGERLHFEEFNQLFGYASFEKYDAAYKDMADFMNKTTDCLPAEIYKLYLRIIAGLLLGNTDMHLKNFAMLHTPDGLRLSPSYDQVAAVIYDYKVVALKVFQREDFPIGNLKSRHIVMLGKEFGLSDSMIELAWQTLGHNKERAKEAISTAACGSPLLKNQLIQYLEKRWNGTFALIGQYLLRKR